MPLTGDIRINESYFTNNSFSQTDSSTNKTKFYYTIRHEIGHILGIGYFAGGGLSDITYHRIHRAR